MQKNSTKKRNPWSFIPSQYFAEGLPYIIVNNLSVAMYKSLNASNAFIGATSFLYLPWAIKFLWGPYVDANRTKRGWVILMEMVLAVLFIALAIGTQLPYFLVVSLIIFTLIAFVSATHDIAIDGYYLCALDQKEQAFFAGIRSTFYRISMIIGSGVLVALAGEISSAYGSTETGWTFSLIIAAAVFLLAFIYHKWILPYPLTDKPVKEVQDSKSTIPFKKAFKQYFTQKHIGVILAYILLYRLGEGILVKMAQPFLLDAPKEGGLGIGLSEVGIMYGTIGVGALVVGGILGGWLVKKISLKKLIFPMALAMNIPNLFYAYLASVKPELLWHIDLTWLFSAWSFDFNPLVQFCILVEQFGYGLGFTSFMIYLIYVSRGKFKTSHYAISTGIMAIGMMVPGFISGFLQQSVGYFWLFTFSFLFSIPGMAIIFFLPIYENGDKTKR